MPVRLATLALVGVLATLVGPGGAAAVDLEDLSTLPLNPPRAALSFDVPSGPTVAGGWRTEGWRVDLADRRLAVDLTLDLAPHPNGFRPGPAVLFWTFGFELIDRENERTRRAVGVVDHEVVPPCQDAAVPCRWTAALETDAAALFEAPSGRSRLTRAWLAMTLIRTFEGGALVQVVQPGAPDRGAVPTLARVRTTTGILEPGRLEPESSLLPGWPEVGFGEEIDVPGIVERALLTTPVTAVGPDPWVPVGLSLTTTKERPCAGYELTLVSTSGDVVYRRLMEEDELAIVDDVRVGRGGTWALFSGSGDGLQALHPGFTAEDAGYVIRGPVDCPPGGSGPVPALTVQSLGPVHAGAGARGDERLMLPLLAALLAAVLAGFVATVLVLRRRGGASPPD